MKKSVKKQKTMNEQNNKEILKEEKKILSEIRKEEGAVKRLTKNVWVLTILIAAVLVGGASIFAYLRISQGRVYTDNADVEAPRIDLAPQGSGILQNVSVHVGDFVNADTVVAQVGNELIKTNVAGIISSTNDNTGKLFNRGESVVSMFDPTEMRVVGKIDEDKGISDVSIGQSAVFTVDAFGSKQYEGVVDEISPISNDTGVVFNISDKRETKQFAVKVRFDTESYPEIKNGMSAKVWIYK